MIKFKHILIESTLKFKKSINGEFIQFDFSDSGNLIGTINLRLKRSWNQLHIDINEEYQGKGYAIPMISAIIEEYGHVSIPEGRIVNSNMNKVINKLAKKFNYYKTSYDEHIIYNGTKSNLELIKKIFDS